MTVFHIFVIHFIRYSSKLCVQHSHLQKAFIYPKFHLVHYLRGSFSKNKWFNVIEYYSISLGIQNILSKSSSKQIGRNDMFTKENLLKDDHTSEHNFSRILQWHFIIFQNCVLNVYSNSIVYSFLIGVYQMYNWGGALTKVPKFHASNISSPHAFMTNFNYLVFQKLSILVFKIRGEM